MPDILSEQELKSWNIIVDHCKIILDTQVDSLWRHKNLDERELRTLVSASAELAALREDVANLRAAETMAQQLAIDKAHDLVGCEDERDALCAEVGKLRRKIEAVENIPDDTHALVHGRNEWAHYEMQLTSRGQFRPVVACNFGTTPWEALGIKEGK